MPASRRTQPYRAGARQPGAALTAMLKGRTAHGFNPADVKRAAYLVAAGKRRTGRPRRQARAVRPPRVPR